MWPTPMATEDNGTPNGKRQRQLGNHPDIRGNTWGMEPAMNPAWVESHGISGRVHRLKQLGNSIVPQVAARILHAIKEVEHARKTDEDRHNEVLAMSEVCGNWRCEACCRIWTVSTTR